MSGRRGSGFVLVELLVGLALFSIGVVAVLTSLRASMGVQERSRHLWRASLVLDQVARELSIVPSESRELEGSTESGIGWVVEIEPWEGGVSFLSEPAPALDLAAVTVSWNERGRTRTLTSHELIPRDRVEGEPLEEPGP